MVLSYVVQRVTEPLLEALTALQFGSLLGELRALLASPAALETFCAVRMLSAALSASAAAGATARRQASVGPRAPHRGGGAPSPPGAASSSSSAAAAGGAAARRRRRCGGREDPHVPERLARRTWRRCAAGARQLRAAPAASTEGAALAALEAAKREGATDFGAAVRSLAALLVSDQAPSAHELQRSSTIKWLLAELGGGGGGGAHTAALRRRWEAFDGAFGTQPDAAGGRALAQLLQLLHNMVAAAERLPVHSHAAGGDGAHSLKPLGEPIQICLHPLTNADGTPTAPSPPPVAAGARRRRGRRRGRR